MSSCWFISDWVELLCRSVNVVLPAEKVVRFFALGNTILLMLKFLV